MGWPSCQFRLKICQVRSVRILAISLICNSCCAGGCGANECCSNECTAGGCNRNVFGFVAMSCKLKSIICLASACSYVGSALDIQRLVIGFC